MNQQNEPIISRELLEVLACPVCKKSVSLVLYQEKLNGLKCPECHRIFPIRNGIPIMIIDEAIKVE